MSRPKLAGGNRKSNKTPSLPHEVFCVVENVNKKITKI